jgi:ABC-type thiamine transport system substrate-binding protein
MCRPKNYSHFIKKPGANPTVVSYNASAVKKSTTPQVAKCVLKAKINSSTVEKRSSLLALLL